MNVKNKKCIRKLSRRSLRASRKRNIIATIAIALTALLFTSLFTIVMSLNSSYEMYTFRQIGAYCHGTFKEVTEEQVRILLSALQAIFSRAVPAALSLRNKLSKSEQIRLRQFPAADTL